MGEVVMSNGGGMKLHAQETETALKKITADDGGTPAEVDISSWRWERFLSKLAVRVLLVEADDSTRQIIAALLRKCSYRVAAVCDGLQAWEVLKARSENIDLILTEVELPSISGYALLTLVMEHDICKNIPVIMMSSHDSVSSVYKCMLRGAADFLVKPVRRNELRNLWQHVWRKQALDGTTSQHKDEATAESNAISNHSSAYMACILRNRECIEKGSDAQNVADTKANYGATRGQEKDSLDKNLDNSHAILNSSREAIDLIGAFDSTREGVFDSFALNASTDKIDSSPPLDLSLRRSHPSSSVNQVNDETRRLNHSDASAFSRYVNKPLQRRNSTPCTCNQSKDYETNSKKQQSNHTPDYNSDTHGSRISSQRYVSVAGIQSGLQEATFPYPQQRLISQPIPVINVKYEDVINGFGTVLPQLYCAQSGLLPLPSPGTASHSPNFNHLNPFYPSDSSPTFHNLLDQRINSNIDASDNKQGQILENLEESGNSGFCTGKMNSVSVPKAISDTTTKEGFHVLEGTTDRASQREAALTKFRLKRKDRCFEKKVRYESRKKLAEQRPRVKGQFVRQLLNDSQPGSSSSG